MNIQPKDSSGGSGETRESLVARQATEMLDKLPADYVPFEVGFISRNNNVVTFAHTDHSSTNHTGLCDIFFDGFSLAFSAMKISLTSFLSLLP